MAITKTPGVCGGSARVGRRRIAVWHLVENRKLGFSDGEIRALYQEPLTRDELHEAWAYYDLHSAEIEKDIEENGDGRPAKPASLHRLHRQGPPAHLPARRVRKRRRR